QAGGGLPEVVGRRLDGGGRRGGGRRGNYRFWLFGEGAGGGALLHGFEAALAPQRGKTDLRRWRVEHSGEQRLLPLQSLPDPFFNTAGGQEVDHVDRTRLSEAMHTADALFEARGVPGRLEV